EGQVSAKLCTNYWQREIVRLHLKLKGKELLEEVEQAAMRTVQDAIASHTLDPADKPIVELRITGMVGFERLDLDTRALQRQLQKESGALVFLLRYDVDTVSYRSPLSEEGDRLHIEEEIYQDIVASHAVYRQHTNQFAKGLAQLKEAYLQGQQEPDLHQFVKQLLDGSVASDL
ncbi:MAG: DNA repair exonuclease, partial [Merismopedia sp. SIO2A8]|nr:DNA repair exonuclease [Merismopedia sp. SIO2A8]